ncbi:MAG: response regulator transcription factor [Rhodobiaceae bacterium]|nr:response regulator transcription factor [Rhodobiaceae bacterium]
MGEKRTGAKGGLPGGRLPVDKEQLLEARAALPGLVRDTGMFDLDYDPSELARMKQIFEHLPDQAVLDLSHRLGSLLAEKQPDLAAFSARHGISPAEQKLLESLIEGLTVVAHAEREGISVNTARTHMRRLLEKTGSGGQLDLIRLAHHKS